jgi:hypothetical protein
MLSLRVVVPVITAVLGVLGVDGARDFSSFNDKINWVRLISAAPL